MPRYRNALPEPLSPEAELAALKREKLRRLALRESTPVINLEQAPDWFHAGQMRGWNDLHRFLIVLAGTQSGKSLFGPRWLTREMQRAGPGDYAIVGPTYTLLEVKAIAEFAKVWAEKGLGIRTRSPNHRFTVDEAGSLKLWGTERGAGSTVYTGYAENPDSLESATYRAVWSDEMGQPAYKRASWDALRRRLSIAAGQGFGRHLATTTPYNLGWLKTDIWDNRHMPDGSGDPEIGCVQFESLENPTFSREEWEGAERTLPRWKFDLYYRAIFTRPAGAIFDLLDPKRHRVSRFTIPSDWRQVAGLDFGGNNTAAVRAAWDQTGARLIVYAEYWPRTQREERDHAEAILALGPGLPQSYGGSHQEGGWRTAFAQSGLPCMEPSQSGPGSVEVRISAIYSALANGKLVISEDCEMLWGQMMAYSRKIDASGNVGEEIDDKAAYHLVDALGYLVISEVSKSEMRNATIGVLADAPVIAPVGQRVWGQWGQG